MGETELGRLDGKVALISGTGGSQGRAAALRFAAEGALVVGADVDQAASEETVSLVQAAGYRMVAMSPVDLGSREGATAWVHIAVEEYGGIDILYNNAGAARYSPFESQSVEDYDFTMHNDFGVVWHSTQAAWPQLVRRGGGSIVNVGSIAGMTGSRFLLAAAHAAAKGAVIALSRQLAAEGAGANIRVNSVSPGLIGTPRVLEMLRTDPTALRPSQERAYNRLPGRPEDVVDAALFLASDEAAYITGANLMVDGGLTALI